MKVIHILTKKEEMHKMQNGTGGYKLSDNIRYSIRMLAKKDRILIFLLAASVAAELAISLLGVYLPSYVVKGLESRAELGELTAGILLFTVVLSAVYYINKFVSTKINWHLISVQAEYVWDTYMKSIRCAYRNIASAEGQTMYQRAKDSVYQGDMGCIKIMIPALLNIGIGVLGAAVYMAVLIPFAWWMVLFLIGMSLIGIWAASRSRNYEQKNKENWSVIDKKLNYFINKATEPSYGKEIRLFSLQKWMNGILDKCLKDRRKWYQKLENRKLASHACNSAIIFLRDGVSYLYLIWCVSEGNISIADFVWYFGIVGSFSQWITRIADQTAQMGNASNLISDFRRFMELPEQRDGGKDGFMMGEQEGTRIEFRNVSFSFDGKKNIIEGLNLTIRPNEKVGIVGINGAGKTTIVNLLCGLYEPVEGEVLIDGIPVRDYPPEAAQKLFSAVFQDAAVFPFTVAENVSMCTEAQTDMERVKECIRTAGLEERIQRTEKGIHSQMSRVLDAKGLMLSGGEQQKLYLARALYQNGRIMILDEPTAALDPLAEREQYLKYESISKGKTAVYISHRLASTSFCDRILFLEKGKILESGSHQELMEKQGKYYEMYETQSRYYKDATGKAHAKETMTAVQNRQG